MCPGRLVKQYPVRTWSRNEACCKVKHRTAKTNMMSYQAEYYYTIEIRHVTTATWYVTNRRPYLELPRERENIFGTTPHLMSRCPWGWEHRSEQIVIQATITIHLRLRSPTKYDVHTACCGGKWMGIGGLDAAESEIRGPVSGNASLHWSSKDEKLNTSTAQWESFPLLLLLVFSTDATAENCQRPPCTKENMSDR